MNNTIIEYVNGMEVVKVFGRDGDSYKRYKKDVEAYRDFTLDWYRVCWPWMAVYAGVFACCSLFTLPFGGMFVVNGWSQLADLILVLCLSFGLGGPLMKAMRFVPSLAQVDRKVKELEKTLDAEPLKSNGSAFTGKSNTAVFENVTFAYEDKDVIQSASLVVQEGKKTALVGESGSGKSTLAKLLVHYYDIGGGKITLGGQDITDMSLDALNDKISFVSQDNFLFNTSIYDNIKVGKPDATKEEVLAAAQKAQCMEFIDRLENGIYTLAGDCGSAFSGGERQRVSLARAILKNAPVVILDEATAFADPENEGEDGKGDRRSRPGHKRSSSLRTALRQFRTRTEFMCWTTARWRAAARIKSFWKATTSINGFGRSPRTARRGTWSERQEARYD